MAVMCDRGTHSAPAEDEGYFASMTDMMVGLLFIFILILMYFALQFHSTAEKLVTANDTRGDILESMREALSDRGIDVAIDPRNGVLHLQERALRFSSGSAVLEPQYQEVTATVAEVLSDILPCYANEDTYVQHACTVNMAQHWIEALFVEGHTDNVPYLGGNLKLSTERAVNTYAALIAAAPALGEMRNPNGEYLLSVSGYGEKRPLSPESNDTPEGRTANRRIDLRIIMATPKQPHETSEEADDKTKITDPKGDENKEDENKTGEEAIRAIKEKLGE